MKKFFKTILPFTLMAFALIGCKKEDLPVYDGDSLLHFNKADQSAFVKLTDAGANYNVTFGTTKVVEGDHAVELVFEPSKSTAVLGTDFTIVQGTSQIVSGQSLGNFVINVTNAGATAGKKAVFTLKSSTLSNAIFNKEVTVTFKLNCPIDSTTFPLTYNVDVYAFNEDAPSHIQTFVPVAGTDNKFKVASAWGPNFVAWATGNNSNAGKYLYKGTLTINCTEVTYVGDDAWAPGGEGTYNPITGVIYLELDQALFSDVFITKCTFTPL